MQFLYNALFVDHRNGSYYKRTALSWVEVPKFQNPELLKFIVKKLQDAYKYKSFQM